MRSFISVFAQLLLSAGAVTAATCNSDNCLRALRNPTRVEEAREFCGTFTASSVTATSAIPSFAVTACTGNVASRVSSACSCVVSSTSTTLSTFTTSTSSTSGISTSSESSVSTSAPTSTPTGFPTSKSCSNPQLSCQNTTVVQDLCCFNAPGGQLLQTQFWDTAPSTGPSDSWTLHGLWPDHCDGTYDSNCDPSREYTNITAILQSYGKTDLLTYMSKYWKDYQGDDESFWEHEWDKHGTCISTLAPSCYTEYTGQAEVVDYFDIAVRLFKGLDSYTTLANANIIPSTTTTYTASQINAALSAAHGFPVTISCTGGALEQIYYHYQVRGSVQTGEFVPTSPDGSKSNCPATGIKYIPKYLPAPTGTTTSVGPSATPTGLPYVGKGYLNAFQAGKTEKTGCLISPGTWFTTGTCATYTATPSGDGFTLSSSKGKCDVIAGIFSCATGNTNSGVFTNLDGKLAYASSADFYAKAVPVGPVQQMVYTTVDAVEVEFIWQSLA